MEVAIHATESKLAQRSDIREKKVCVCVCVCVVERKTLITVIRLAAIKKTVMEL